jgi:hypothetical protein
VKFYRDGLNVEADDPPRIMLRDGNACEIFKTKDGDIWFITLEDTHYCAHGESFHDAVIAAKEKQNPGAGKSEAVERIQKSGVVNLTDFCLATGACRAGAISWIKEEGLSVKTEMKVSDILARLEKSSSGSWGQTLREELVNEWIN